MSRLGLAGRLILALAIGLALIQLLTAAAYMADRRRDAPEGPFLPFPDQLAAMVALFDTADAPRRALLLRAFTDSTLEVSVAATPPESEPPRPGEAAGDLALPGLAERLRGYSGVLGSRPLRVAIPAPEAEGLRLPRLRALLNPERVRIAVRLADGDWLVVQRQRAAGLAVGGLPVGLFSALLSVGFALFAMVAIWLETRPLRRLGAAARAFGQSLQPVPLAPRGAPDLRRLIAAFNAMQERVARLDRGRTDMIAAFAHDVRTPLARLRLRLRKLDPALQDAAARDIDEIARTADEAFRFAAADLARLEEEIDLTALLVALARRSGAEFRSDGATARIRGNAALLNRAFGNLVANALLYGGTCRIALAARPAPTVTIEDDGPGIPEAERARLLEPFERGEGSRNRATGGSGLGLALANRIVTRHGGSLALGAATSRGLRITVTLPAA